MRQRTLLIFLFFSGCLLPGLCQWSALHSGTTSDLKDVFFTDANTGWVAGKNGILKKTSNGGATWSSQTSGTSKELKSIHFADANTGWAVGKESIVLKTVNGGNTWVSKPNPAHEDLYAVAFYGTGTGVAVGKDGTIITTADGGETWTLRTVAFSGDLHAVQFVSASVVLAGGEHGTLLKSADAGASWSTVSSSGLYDIINFHFVSENKGYWVPEADGSEGGSEGILYAYNGSTASALTLPTSKQLLAVHFLTENLGWAVGEKGRILRTVNGGTNWTAHTLSNIERDLVSVHFVSAQTGYAVGEDGTILKYGSVPASVTENEPLPALVYPNPFSTQVQIHLTEPAGEVLVYVTDMTGRSLGQWPLTQNGLLLETGAWKPGIYLVRLEAEYHSRTFKIVKND